MTIAQTDRWFELIERYPMEAVETASGLITCRRAGSGLPVVLMHGIGSGSGSWVHQLEALSGDFQLSAWDLPGYGGSTDPKSDDVDAYAAVLKHFFDALQIARAVIVGHSLSAMIAARFAYAHPHRVRGLVLASPAAGHSHLLPKDAEAKYRERVDRFAQMSVEAHAATRAPTLLSDAATADQIGLVAHGMSLLRANGYGAAARLLRDGDLIADVKRLSLPALVLCGTKDTITPPDGARRVAKAFATPAPYHDIPGAGHAIYIEAPAVFAGHIRAFVEGLS